MKKAFTLIEIMIVVVIIGLLAAMIIPACKKVHSEGCKDKLCKREFCIKYKDGMAQEIVEVEVTAPIKTVVEPSYSKKSLEEEYERMKMKNTIENLLDRVERLENED